MHIMEDEAQTKTEQPVSVRSRWFHFGCLTSCKNMSHRQRCALVGVCLIGLLKGIIMLPVILLSHVLICILINMIALFSTVDYLYAGVRFSKRLGPKIKVVLYVLMPFGMLFYFCFSPVLAGLAAIGLSLVLPIYATLDDQRQSAYRHVLLTSGWREMFRVTGKNMEAYISFFYIYIPSRVREEALAPQRGEPFDIHPGNYALALLALLFGGLALALALVGLLMVKLLPMLGRAYLSHVRSAGQWFKGGKLGMILGFVAVLFVGIPLLAVAMFPVAFCYAFVVSGRAAAAIVDSRGSCHIGTKVFLDSFEEVNKLTSKYIFNQDVPFVVIPSTNPIHLAWLLAGIIPFFAGLLINALTLPMLSLLCLIPVTVSAYLRVWRRLGEGGKATKPGMVILLYFLLVLLPAVVVVVIALLILKALAGLTGVFMVMNKSKSFEEGFRYVLAINYMFEYPLNVFSFRIEGNAPVHWASRVGFLREWARPYMHPSLFDIPDLTVPVSVVTAPARFVPAGMRKPRKDAEGRVIDMTRAGYHFQGVGMAPIVDGQVGPIIPQGAPGAPVPSGTVLPSALYRSHVVGNDKVEHDEQPPAATDANNTPVEPHKAPAAIARDAEPDVPQGFHLRCLCCGPPPFVDPSHAALPAVAAPTKASTAARTNDVTVADPQPIATEDVAIDVHSPTKASARPDATPGSPADRPLASVALVVDAKPAVDVLTPARATGASAMPDFDDSPNIQLSPAHEKASLAMKMAQQALQQAAATTALAKQTREQDAIRSPEGSAGAISSPVHHFTTDDVASPQHHQDNVAEPEVERTTSPQRTPNADRNPSEESNKPADPHTNDDGDVNDEDEEEEDEAFVLMPIVRPDLADEWVPVKQNDETYFVNYARNQSSWSIPPGC